MWLVHKKSYKLIKQTNPNSIISLTKIPLWGMYIAKWDKHTFLMITQNNNVMKNCRCHIFIHLLISIMNLVLPSLQNSKMEGKNMKWAHKIIAHAIWPIGLDV